MKETATVKFFANDKGWGFLIDPIDPNEDIFVHYKNILQDGYKSLAEGQQVEFVRVKTEKGFSAVEVVKIDESQSSYPESSSTLQSPDESAD